MCYDLADFRLPRDRRTAARDEVAGGHYEARVIDVGAVALFSVKVSAVVMPSIF